MQSARDIAIALEAVSGSDVSSVRGAGPPAVKPRPRWAGLAAGFGLLVAAAAGGYPVAIRLAPRTTPDDLPRYTQLTFRRGEIRRARFTPDGQSVVYSAVWDSEPQRVYSVRLDISTGWPLPPIADAALLAVSHRAIWRSRRAPASRTFMELGNAGRRSRSAAVLRGSPPDVEPGRPFHRMGASPSSARREGRSRLSSHRNGGCTKPLVGFRRRASHPPVIALPSMSIRCTTTTRDGRPSLRSRRGPSGIWRPNIISLSGLAWTPDGRGGVLRRPPRTISCVAISDPRRSVTWCEEHRAWILHDIASDGRMLASAYTVRASLAAGQVGEREVDLSWQDVAYPVEFSADGRRLLFGDIGYGVSLRPLDGGPPVRLGDGVPAGLSPDGRFVPALTPDVPTRLILLLDRPWRNADAPARRSRNPYLRGMDARWPPHRGFSVRARPGLAALSPESRRRRSSRFYRGRRPADAVCGTRRIAGRPLRHCDRSGSGAGALSGRWCRPTADSRSRAGSLANWMG